GVESPSLRDLRDRHCRADHKQPARRSCLPSLRWPDSYRVQKRELNKRRGETRPDFGDKLESPSARHTHPENQRSVATRLRQTPESPPARFPIGGIIPGTLCSALMAQRDGAVRIPAMSPATSRSSRSASWCKSRAESSNEPARDPWPAGDANT